jgi:hypothetical protein
MIAAFAVAMGRACLRDVANIDHGDGEGWALVRARRER